MIEAQQWAKDAVRGGETWDDGERHVDFLKQQGVGPYRHVLDLACGPLRTGVWLMTHLEPGRYVGVDNEPAMVAEARRVVASNPCLAAKEPTIRVVRDLELVQSFPHRRFDVVWSYSLFTHLAPVDITKALDQVRQLLRPAGRYFASFNISAAPVIGPKSDRWDHLTTAHYPISTIEACARAARMKFRIVSGPLSPCYHAWGQTHLQQIGLFQPA